MQLVCYLIVLLAWRPTEASGGHVGAANSLNLLHATELWLGQQLSEGTNQTGVKTCESCGQLGHCAQNASYMDTERQAS